MINVPELWEGTPGNIDGNLAAGRVKEFDQSNVH